ncbi:MAG TPA: hypothetical protein VJN01_02095, partial [Xanthomonadales bacterium]|nr:hypothetical protein [Xanthomonadales bacterium]
MINRPQAFLQRISIFICPLLLAIGLAACDRPAAETEAPAKPAASSDTAVQAEPVTLVFNGLIHTFDPGNTVVEGGAMALAEDGEILAIGSDE